MGEGPLEQLECEAISGGVDQPASNLYPKAKFTPHPEGEGAGEGSRWAGELRAVDGLTQSLLAFNGASLISSPERWLRPSPPASISRAALCQRIYDKLIAEGETAPGSKDSA